MLLFAGCKDVKWDFWNEEEEELVINFVTSALPEGTVGEPYSTTIEAIGGTTPYSWAIVIPALPSGLTLDEDTGEISGTPDTEGSFLFKVGISDSAGNYSDKQYGIAINILTITNEPDLPKATLGVSYTTTLSAVGGTGSYNWFIQSGDLPPGLSLNASTGTISGTPSETGTWVVTIGVSDSYGNIYTKVIVITVEAVTITNASPLSDGTVGMSYDVDLNAVGGNTPYSWAVTWGFLPPGMVINDQTGRITGTPTATGIFEFYVGVTESDGGSSSKLFSITVKTVVITTAGPQLPDGKVGDFYSTTISAADGVTPYTWTISQGSLPPGLSIGASSGTISGTPTNEGLRAFAVRVTDNYGSWDENWYSISINPIVSITTTGPLPAGEVNKPYSTTIHAKDGITPYAWLISSGSLPPGLNIGASTGTISGTPTTDGTYSFTVRVQDDSGDYDTQGYSITISPESPSSYTIYANGTNYTGYLYNYTTKYVGKPQVAIYYRWGWMKFDLSSIPAGKTVTSVTLHWYVESAASTGMICSARRLSVDASSSSVTGSDIYNDLYFASDYVTGIAPSTIGWKTISLNSQAATDLQGAISSPGWFGLGFPSSSAG